MKSSARTAARTVVGDVDYHFCAEHAVLHLVGRIRCPGVCDEAFVRHARLSTRASTAQHIRSNRLGLGVPDTARNSLPGTVLATVCAQAGCVCARGGRERESAAEGACKRPTRSGTFQHVSVRVSSPQFRQSLAAHRRARTAHRLPLCRSPVTRDADARTPTPRPRDTHGGGVHHCPT